MESETASLMERVSASREKLVATAERYDHEVAMFRQVRPFTYPAICYMLAGVVSECS